ncbi:MAG: CapA family protein [Clostridia bacterium]|nr:CapA family protein [Clostridia bacterium]
MKLLPAILLMALCSASAACGADTVRVQPDLPPLSPDAPPSRWALTEAAHEELPPDPPVETARIRMIAAGDNVVHPSIRIDAARRSADGGHDFLPMYADAADYIAAADAAFINQETLMGGDALGFSGYPRFNGPQQMGRDLVTLGFDVVNIANNHMADKGEAGLRGTIDFFESLPEITLIGGYRDAADYDDIRVTEHGGLRVAWLSYTEHTNGMSLPRGTELVAPYTDDEDIVRQCALAEEIADVTIVSVHWGDENRPVNAEQRRLAALMSEHGADVILGHHPHVLQPIEWIGDTLCAYSLGNLASGMAEWQNMIGGFLEFELVQMSDGAVRVENPAFVPTVFHYGANNLGTHLYFLRDYTETLAAKHGTGHIYGSRATAADMRAYAEKIMGDFLRIAP